MVRCVVAKHLESGTHESHDAIGVTAGAAAGDDFTSLLEPREGAARIRRTAHERPEVGCKRGQSEGAWPALASILRGHPLRDARGLGDATALIPKRDNDASAYRCAERPQRLVGVWEVKERPIEPRAAISPEEHGGGVRHVENVAKGRAECDFDHGRVFSGLVGRNSSFNRIYCYALPRFLKRLSRKIHEVSRTQCGVLPAMRIAK